MNRSPVRYRVKRNKVRKAKMGILPGTGVKQARDHSKQKKMQARDRREDSKAGRASIEEMEVD